MTARGAIESGPLDGTSGFGLTIRSCTLWAPACTVDLFQQAYQPAIERRRLQHFSLFTLTDKAERDDNCANIYHKSLLYLVSDAFEKFPRIPMVRDGMPILGMEKFVGQDPALVALLGDRWIQAPNTEPVGSPNASGARHHGDFDNDAATLRLPSLGFSPAMRRARPARASQLSAGTRRRAPCDRGGRRWTPRAARRPRVGS